MDIEIGWVAILDIMEPESDTSDVESFRYARASFVAILAPVAVIMFLLTLISWKQMYLGPDLSRVLAVGYTNEWWSSVENQLGYFAIAATVLAISLLALGRRFLTIFERHPMVVSSAAALVVNSAGSFYVLDGEFFKPVDLCLPIAVRSAVWISISLLLSRRISLDSTTA